MCLQCVVAAKPHGKPGVETPFASFILMRATAENRLNAEWEKDQLGLVRMNHPTFVLTVEPVKDPFHGLTDDEVDKIPLDDPRWLDEQSFARAATAFSRDLCESGNPDAIYLLMKEGVEKGYDSDMDGAFTYWLSDYLARWIETHPLVLEVDAVEPLHKEIK